MFFFFFPKELSTVICRLSYAQTPTANTPRHFPTIWIQENTKQAQMLNFFSFHLKFKPTYVGTYQVGKNSKHLV